MKCRSRARSRCDGSSGSLQEYTRGRWRVKDQSHEFWTKHVLVLKLSLPPVKSPKDGVSGIAINPWDKQRLLSFNCPSSSSNIQNVLNCCFARIIDIFCFPHPILIELRTSCTSCVNNLHELFVYCFRNIDLHSHHVPTHGCYCFGNQ